jgi:hypothetical protein
MRGLQWWRRSGPGWSKTTRCGSIRCSQWRRILLGPCASPCCGQSRGWCFSFRRRRAGGSAALRAESASVSCYSRSSPPKPSSSSARRPTPPRPQPPSRLPPSLPPNLPPSLPSPWLVIAPKSPRRTTWRPPPPCGPRCGYFAAAGFVPLQPRRPFAEASLQPARQAWALLSIGGRSRSCGPRSGEHCRRVQQQRVTACSAVPQRAALCRSVTQRVAACRSVK